MKTKLTVTMDETLIPQAKRYARQHNRSPSSLIEKSLRNLTSESSQSFSQQWLGKLSVSKKRMLAIGNLQRNIHENPD